MNTGGFSKPLIYLRFLVVMFCSLNVAGVASAADLFAEDSCDPKYMESLEARAWLEAQREVIQNQNLIFKPDSVLEYSCFDSHLTTFIESSALLLSGNPLFGGSVADVEAAIDAAVIGPNEDYIAANFGHTFLGGRSEEDYEAGMNPCPFMDIVWMEAKCMDFIHQPDHDGFFTFEEYVDADFRTLPEPCGDNGPFQDNIDIALNPDDTPWEEDFVFLYMEIIYPEDGECGGEASMIPTGLTVLTDRFDFEQYQEHACLVYGCKFIPTGEDDGCCTRGDGC